MLAPAIFNLGVQQVKAGEELPKSVIEKYPYTLFSVA